MRRPLIPVVSILLVVSLVAPGVAVAKNDKAADQGKGSSQAGQASSGKGQSQSNKPQDKATDAGSAATGKPQDKAAEKPAGKPEKAAGKPESDGGKQAGPKTGAAAGDAPSQATKGDARTLAADAAQAVKPGKPASKRTEGEAAGPGLAALAAAEEVSGPAGPDGLGEQDAPDSPGVSGDSSPPAEPGTSDEASAPAGKGIANAFNHITANLEKSLAKVASGAKKQLPPGLVRVWLKFAAWLGIDTSTIPGYVAPTVDPPATVEPTTTVEPSSTVEPTGTVDPPAPTDDPTATVEPTGTIEPTITPEPDGLRAPVELPEP